jgi:hypothetical protein
VEYKKGRENKVEDGLSRVTHSAKILAISTVVPVWMEQVNNTYEEDTQCLELLAKLSIDPNVVSNHSFNSGVLRFKGKLWTGNTGPLRQQLLDSFHKSALGGHSGERATCIRLQLVFYWPNMQQQVKHM